MPSAGAVGLGEMPLELRQFRYFVAVVEEGQVTRAARRLHMAQPALSQAIAQLERQVGVALLERHARGVRPTDAGEAFLAKARSAVVAADEAEIVAEAWARAESGELVIGFLPVALVVAGPLLDDLRTLYPHVRLTLRELNFATQVRELRAGRLDAEIIAPARPIDGLDTIELHAAQRVVVMSRRHRLAGRPSLVFADIAEERLPGGHRDVPQDWLDYNWLTEERGRRPAVTDEMPITPEECIPLLAGGDVIAISPEFVARSMSLHGIVMAPWTDVAPYTVGLAARQGDQRPAVKALMKLGSRFRSEAAGGDPRLP